jgi:hypothetical protein
MSSTRARLRKRAALRPLIGYLLMMAADGTVEWWPLRHRPAATGPGTAPSTPTHSVMGCIPMVTEVNALTSSLVPRGEKDLKGFDDESVVVELGKA